MSRTWRFEDHLMHSFDDAMAQTNDPIAHRIIVSGNNAVFFDFVFQEGTFGGGDRITMYGIQIDPIKITVGKGGKHVSGKTYIDFNAL
jgi:hypothetical protein